MDLFHRSRFVGCRDAIRIESALSLNTAIIDIGGSRVSFVSRGKDNVDLIAIQQYLTGERKKISAALATLDAAVDALYEHTQFRSVSHELFRAAVEGRITTDQEQSLRDLGIRI